MKALGITQQLSYTKDKIGQSTIVSTIESLFFSDFKCLREQFTEPLDIDVHFNEEFMQEAKTIHKIKSVKLTHTHTHT